jgi:hypothetical protein
VTEGKSSSTCHTVTVLVLKAVNILSLSREDRMSHLRRKLQTCKHLRYELVAAY